MFKSDRDLNWDYKSFFDQPHLMEMLEDQLHFANINPNKVTLALDLACGNGAGALAIANFGVRRDRITGIDIEPPSTPLITGINWDQANLAQAYSDLFLEQRRTPLEKYWQRADIVLCLFDRTGLFPGQVSRLCHYFAKRNGFVYIFP